MEIYTPRKDPKLPDDVEAMFPDYSIYGIEDTAYGFITRGCPRGCDFCHVKQMQGSVSKRVAELSSFWNGQKNIVLLDPNILACNERLDILRELAETRSYVDFSQGLDARLLTEEIVREIGKVKLKRVHFAWDRYEDRDIIVPKLKMLKELTGWSRQKIIVYTIVGNKSRSVTDQDLERIYTLRSIGCDPYVMIYDKSSLPRSHELKDLQRWVNNRMIWGWCETFEQYKQYKENRNGKTQDPSR